MNFDEWLDEDETIILHEIERYDLETVWNAAIDESIRIIESQTAYHPSVVDFNNNLNATMIKRDDAIRALSNHQDNKTNQL